MSKIIELISTKPTLNKKFRREAENFFIHELNGHYCNEDKILHYLRDYELFNSFFAITVKRTKSMDESLFFTSRVCERMLTLASENLHPTQWNCDFLWFNTPFRYYRAIVVLARRCKRFDLLLKIFETCDNSFVNASFRNVEMDSAVQSKNPLIVCFFSTFNHDYDEIIEDLANTYYFYGQNNEVFEHAIFDFLIRANRDSFLRVTHDYADKLLEKLFNEFAAIYGFVKSFREYLETRDEARTLFALNFVTNNTPLALLIMKKNIVPISCFSNTILVSVFVVKQTNFAYSHRRCSLVEENVFEISQ